MKIKHYERFTISWHWPYWRQWGVRRIGSGSYFCLALGPLGVTMWRRGQG